MLPAARHLFAILKSGTRGERFFLDSRFIPFLFARNIFLLKRRCDQNREKEKIKLLICNGLRIWKVKARVVKSLYG
jgi:hypothetical protein